MLPVRVVNAGRFTAFIGFEWTSDPKGNNPHRNVIFRDGNDKADQIIPFSAVDSLDPEQLWRRTSGASGSGRRHGRSSMGSSRITCARRCSIARRSRSGSTATT